MILFAQATSARGFLDSPLVWGLAIAALGFWLMIVTRRTWTRRLADLLGLLGLAVLAMAMPHLGDWSSQLVFWMMALVAVGGAAAAIASTKPVYTAIYFAVSLLGVAGLFLLQQAQFLGVATIIVYAGAIIVTFLFVLMLAQPEGHASYDRISWSTYVVPLSVLATAGLLIVILSSVEPGALIGRSAQGQVQSPDHMARLGTELFSTHLVGIELAGTLLLVALVGAIAIVIHGRPPRRRDHSVQRIRAAETGGDSSPLGRRLPGGSQQ